MVGMSSPASPPTRREFIVPLVLSALTCGLYFLFQVISISLYPGDYNIARDYISSGGSPDGNPDGFIVWMVGHVLYGICMGLLLWVDYQKVRGLQPERLKGSRGVVVTGLVFSSVSVVGWLLMGTVPNFHGEGYRVMHGVNAALLLGGYHLGMIYWSITLLHTPSVPKSFSRTVMGLTLAAPIGFIASQAYNLLSGIGLGPAIDGTGAWFLTIPFWEWMVMFGITAAFVVMSLGLKANAGLAPRNMAKE
jgi:hypothetical protein